MRTWVWIPSIHMRSCVLVYICNPRTGEVELGEWQVLGASHFSPLVSSMIVRSSVPRNKMHNTGGSAPEVDLCLHAHVHTCIYTLAHICMLHTQIVIMFSGIMAEIHAVVLPCWNWVVLFLGEREKKASVFLAKSLVKIGVESLF